jgi:NitT/TauT family transport system substrate-binding protein
MKCSIVALTVAAAAWNGLTAQAFAQKIGTEGNPLVIATGPFFGFLPSYRVADDLKAQGIAVKTIDFPSATERVEAVAAGYAQVAYAGITASILLRARGKDDVIVATTNEKGRALVSKPDILDIKGLKGKTIGVQFGSIEQMTLIALLRQNGLDPDKDVTIVNIPATEQPIALKGGTIDAYMGFEPWASYGVKNFGGKILSYPYNTSLGGIDSGIETTEDFIKKYPELVQKIVTAHVKAVKYYKANPKDVIEAGVRSYKVPEDIMKQAMQNIDLTYNINEGSIKALAKFLVEMKFINQNEYDHIDWAKFINPSFVDAATK